MSIVAKPKLNIGPASIESTGTELIFDTGNGRVITLEELIKALDQIEMLTDFIEDSSLREEYKEYKMFRKLQE